jgi:general secretion pathway protein L
MPAGMRLSRRRPSLIVVLQDDDARISVRRGNVLRELGALNLDGKNQPKLRLEFDELVRGVARRSAEIVLELPPDRVLRREVSLPLAARENLREVLSFEMDRHTPFQAEEVAYDHRIVRTDAAAKRVAVELAVVPRAFFDRAVALANALGAPPDRISIEGNDGEFNFMPSLDHEGKRFGSRLVLVLALLTFVLALIAIYLPLHMRYATLAELERELAEGRTAAVELDALRKRANAALERTRFLVDQRRASPTVVALLDEVTERLPDSTWLTQLGVHGNQIALAGFSPAAASLVAGLEDSPLLSDVHFASPVTVDPRVGLERFNLSAVITAPES